MEYRFQELDKKWQAKWVADKTYQVSEDPTKPKYYVLDMFPYPSGTGLHVGHPLGYVASDIYARYKRLKGFNVLHPMGYDAFGLPAEQYAIETGQHPSVTTEANILRYRSQLDKIGFSFDWSREVKTSDPSFYKWTQWIFLQLYNSWYNPINNKAEPISTLEKILATEGNENIHTHHNTCTEFITSEHWNQLSEKNKSDILMQYRLMFLDNAYVWYCPALGCVLANDEVKDGLSERGGFPVERRKMRQWFQRITAYADRLLEGLEKIDWSNSIKEIQRNWIGKSIGAEIHFDIADSQDKITVFTTRPDTIFGVSFLVLAPEHALVAALTSDTQRDSLQEYVKYVNSRSERERMSEVKKITGAFTGSYAIHPFTGEQIPIWISEYVLATYGTGAIMAVPSGDERDYNFAKHFELPIINIIADHDIEQGAFTEKNGTLINSQNLDGMEIPAAIAYISDEIEKKKIGKKKINFKMRDAGFARQRYWGEPFPILYKDDQVSIVATENLPVILPEVESYTPTGTGESPLANITDWVNEVSGYQRETDTMPGNAGSSWYFLRYMDPKNDTAFASEEKLNYWNQVDLYVGGAEHATGHLFYSRLWTKVLHDLGYLSFDEPFQKLINQGMILGESGEKMSKRLGNTVNPDDMVEQYGADCFRMYEMFLGPLEDSKPWNTKGIDGVARFLKKLWNVFFDANDIFTVSDEKATDAELKLLHKLIKKIQDDIERFSFNTCVSAYMIFVNEITATKCNKREILEPMVVLLAPFAPHLAEELWERLGHTTSVTQASFPSLIEKYLIDESFNYPVAINGKTKCNVEFSTQETRENIEAQVILDEKVKSYIGDAAVKKIILVPNKMINIVIG